MKKLLQLREGMFKVSAVGCYKKTMAEKSRLLFSLVVLIFSLFLFTSSCTKDPVKINLAEMKYVDSVLWHHYNDSVSIDLDNDNVKDISFKTTAIQAPSGYSKGSGYIKTLNGKIEYLANSFNYYYCCDTSIYTNSQYDTVYYYNNCEESDTICEKVTNTYSIVKKDSLGFFEGFYISDSVKLYKWFDTPINPSPGAQNSINIKEGDFYHHSDIGFIFLRWKKGEKVKYYSIKTRWSSPYFYIEKIYMYKAIFI